MKVLLIDDEPLALYFLERQINKLSGIEVVKTLMNFDTKGNHKLIQSVDVIFLDIEMPEISGLELAEKILEVKPSINIVFVTAFKEYAAQAFELNALDYIVKPVQLERLKKTFDRIGGYANVDQKGSSMLGNKLCIHVCEELSFQVGEGNLQTVQWRTAKAKELFLYLLLHEGKTLSKSELMELLWPTTDFSHDYSQLYTAIYHVRKKLRAFSGYFSLRSISSGYQLTTHNASTDIMTWEENILNSPPIDADSIADYELTMELYTGSYLQAEDYLWAEPERYRVEILWLKTAHQMADFYVSHNDLEKAEIWYSKICTLKPEEEKAHYQLMKIYDQLGYGLLVGHQFSQLQEALDDLDIQVSPHIQKWYDKRSKSTKEIHH